jgi:hypothetical protein
MKLHEAHFFMAGHEPLVVTTSVSGPDVADTAPVLRDRSEFANDADWYAYLEREREAAQRRGHLDFAALAAEELAKR